MRRLALVLAGFAGITSLAGGIALIAGAIPTTSILAHTPFGSYVLPGLLLAGVVGGLGLACAVLAWRRARAWVDLAILAGGALIVWIVAELAMLRAWSWLQALYLGLGGALLALGVRAAWRSGSPRYRWMLLVTAAEALGYLAPTLAGIAVTRAQLAPTAELVALAAAGFVEGFALGSGQARALPFRVARLRYALLTGAAASAVWASVMALMLAPHPLVLAPVVAVVGLGAIGSAQWLELRRHVTGAARWIGWTALAWSAALPLSFLPGPFVDEATPLPAHLALWALGGVLMAAVMAVITWQAVARATPRRDAPDRTARQADPSQKLLLASSAWIVPPPRSTRSNVTSPTPRQ
jgi:hypothetical protein